MKSNSMRKFFQTNFLISLAGFQFLSVFSMMIMLLLSTGCGENSTADKIKEVVETATSSNKNVHVAFAGGGWRAHTGHSAWVMSLLPGHNHALSDAFKHVGTISSNSGGSWFSTMLMYSEDFVNDIQSHDAILNWASTGSNGGWLGQQENHFNAAGCGDHSGELFDVCVGNYYSTAGDLHWASTVENLVFRDYPINVKLRGKRQTWAKDKPLLLAATLLTTEVVLNGTTAGNKRYYEACINPDKPIMNGDDGANCSGGSKTSDVTPVTFSSIPDDLNMIAPQFLPASGGREVLTSYINVGYTSTKDKPAVVTNILPKPLINDNVNVMVAASASSAAAGFEASRVVSESDYWVDSYESEELALSFSIQDSVEFLDIENLPHPQGLARINAVRIADGGPVDNTGVAQLVSFLQLNSKAEGFNIVAFDNVQALYPGTDKSAAVGTDIAYLFGKGLTGPDNNQFCSELHGKGTCVTVPNLQIFELHPLTSTKAKWSKTSSDSTDFTEKLIYTPYEVITVDNSNFAVEAGTKGTLHAFTCVRSNADTAPQNKVTDGDFVAYGEMLQFINNSLKEKDNEGLKHLERALGFNPE